jgi:hypothetical protein
MFVAVDFALSFAVPSLSEMRRIRSYRSPTAKA